MIRLGPRAFGAHYTISIIRDPQTVLVIIKAPMLHGLR